MQPFKVHTRWRPLTPSESGKPSISHTHTNSSISISLPNNTNNTTNKSSRTQTWKSSPSFTHILNPEDTNKTVFDAIVRPVLPCVLQGQTCNFFAYGHSGSGKSHTIVGYEFEDPREMGLCLAAARELVDAVATASGGEQGGKQTPDKLGLGIRIYEVRKNSAFDLLNNRKECFVREGADGKVYIRGETEVLDGGRVRVRPVVTKACWEIEDVRREMRGGLALRATGTSSVHDLSSRTHCVVEMEVVTGKLLEAREAVVERQSELVPVGKYATDVYIEEHRRALVKGVDGGWALNPEYVLDQARIDAAEAEKREFEARVVRAEQVEREVFEETRGRFECVGGKFVFVDLAGSEYCDAGGTNGAKQTAQEKQEGRQINTDLLALKEVIRARALNKSRIPFRSSPLTMVLREHFQLAHDSHSAMILTVSPSAGQFAATMNTLKYGNLVGAAGGKK